MLHIFYTLSGIFKACQNTQFSSIKYFSIFLLYYFEEYMERVNLIYNYSSTAGFIENIFPFSSSFLI